MSPFADFLDCRRSLTLIPCRRSLTSSGRGGTCAFEHRPILGLSFVTAEQSSVLTRNHLRTRWASAGSGSSKSRRASHGLQSACCYALSVRSASPSTQKKKVRENRRTPACLTVRMRTWTLIPSLPPHAGKENERRTGCHPRRPRNRPRRAGRQGETILHIQRSVARRRRRLSAVDLDAARPRRARQRENLSIPVGTPARQRNGARPLGAQVPRFGKKRLCAHRLRCRGLRRSSPVRAARKA